jgi:predicted class III extradiol MEMO1 family dioxygenase
MNGLHIKYDTNLTCFQNQMRVCTTKVLVADKMNFDTTLGHVRIDSTHFNIIFF